MGFLRALLFLLIGSTAFATQHSPWLPPLWEFQSRTAYHFEHASRVESPEGNFSFSINDSSLHQSLELTIWPYWNVEAELYLTHTYNVPFSYEASFLTLRYLLFDELSGDYFNLDAGLTCSFAGSRFLHNFNYPYHGNFNAELFASIGKEWPLCQTGYSRLWGMCAIGQGNRGVPWMHGLIAWHAEPIERTGFGVWMNWLVGFGSNAIIEDEPFPGYALIGHRNVDVGAFVNCPICTLGTLTFFGRYNLYAHNFVIHEYAVGAALKVPFSL